MGINAGGVNTVDFLRHPSNVPVAVGQLVTNGTNYYVVVSTGGRNATTGDVEVSVRQITALAAASTLTLQNVDPENDPDTITGLAIP